MPNVFEITTENAYLCVHVFVCLCVCIACVWMCSRPPYALGMGRFPDSLSASAKKVNEKLKVNRIGLKSVHRLQVGICIAMHRF